MDHLDLAIHNTAHKDENTAKELAQKLGMSYQVFINKVNFNNDTHKLTLREALAIMLLSDDPQILYALARELNCTVHQSPSNKNYDLITASLNVNASVGEAASAITKAMEDGKVTVREQHEVRAALLKAGDRINHLGVSFDDMATKMEGAE